MRLLHFLQDQSELEQLKTIKNDVLATKTDATAGYSDAKHVLQGQAAALHRIPMVKKRKLRGGGTFREPSLGLMEK